MRKFALRSLINAAGFYIAAFALTAVVADKPAAGLIAGIILALLSFTLRPLLMLVGTPLNLITLGFFILIINTLMVMLAGKLTPGLHIGGFWAAFLTALLITVLNWFFQRYNRTEKDKIEI